VSPWSVGREIATQLGMSSHMNVYQLRQAVASDLRTRPRLVVVDEIDYAHEPVVQYLRMIHDEGGVGMVFAGTAAYLRRLRGYRSATVRQVLGRIKHAVHLPPCSDDDLSAILAPYDLAEEALEAIVDGAHGEARRAVNCIVAAQRMNGKHGISPELVHRAYETLMPWED